MNKSKLTTSLNIKPTSMLAILFIMVTPSVASAADVDIHQILYNLRTQIIGPFTQVLLIFCYLAGAYFIFRGIAFLKQFGVPLTQMSRPGELGGPMLYILVGSLLIYVPTTTEISSQTVFGNSQAGIFQGDSVNYANAGLASEELSGYMPQGIEQKWADLINTLVLFIEFIGFIAFIRGLFIMAKAGNPGVQPGAVSKGIVHLVGGVIAINFIPAAKIVHNSLFK